MKKARCASLLGTLGVALACTRPVPPPEGSPGQDAAVVAEAADASPPLAPGAGDAGAGEAADAGAPAAAAAPAPPSPPPFTSATAVVASGPAQPVSRDGVTLVDPASSFSVELGARLVDGRLSLRDESDAMVASTGTTELGDAATRYRLVPDEPLRPGSRYALHLDGALTREPHDGEGRAYAPLVIQLKTTGERPATPKRKRGSRR